MATYIPIIVAIISATALIIANGRLGEIKNLFSNNVESAIAKNPKISEILENLGNLPQVKKAVLVKVHNSGMKIMAGDSIYGTIIYPTSWRSTLNQQVLDIEYQEKVIKPLLTDKKVTIDVNDLEKHLKSILKVQGVKTSVCYFITMLPEKFFFVAVDFEVIESEITDYAKDEMRKAVNEIKLLMK